MSDVRSRPGDPCPLRAERGRLVAARLDADPMMQRSPVAVAEIWHSPNFLSRGECKALIAMIDRDLRPSPLLTPDRDPDYRNSQTCDLDAALPEVRRFDDRLSQLLGIPYAFGEAPQGQRYAPGQQFKPHCDWFHEDQPYWPEMAAQGGQRTFTAMIYLDEPEAGGETLFLHAGLRFTPTRGLLLVWNNLKPDGSPNQGTLHEGVQVTAGVKRIVTKWYREAPWALGAPRPY